MPIVLPPPTVGLSSGSPEFALLGSGRAILGGVESYYVYGDLVMNDRKNYDTYIIKEIDGLADAEVRDSRETIPQAHGEHTYTSWYGGRTIVLSGTIRAYNIHKLRDLQEALKLTFADMTEQPLKIISPFATAPHHSLEGEFEAPAVEIMCKKSQPIQMRDVQQNFSFTRDFLLTLRASEPFFKSQYVELHSQANITSPYNFSMTNIGNYRALPEIILTGPMTNPTLTNDTNGDVMQLTATLTSGQTRTINAEERSLVDQTGANKFSELSVASDWLGVDSGDNDFTLTFTGSPTSVTAVSISFKHTWI
jgi:hypothetical protein